MKKLQKTKTLREAFRRDLILEGRSEKTVESYLGQVRGLAKFYMRSPDLITNEEVKTYLLHLIEERHLAFSSCNVAVW